jgi:hypothetical protein
VRLFPGISCTTETVAVPVGRRDAGQRRLVAGLLHSVGLSFVLATSGCRRFSGSPSKVSNQFLPMQVSKLEFQKLSSERASKISWESPSSKRSCGRP